MSFIKNNPLQVNNEKEFLVAKTNHTFFCDAIQESSNSKFLEWVKDRIADKSYQIIFALRVGDIIDETKVQKIKYGLSLIKENFKDINFKFLFATPNQFYTSEEFEKLLTIEKHIQDNFSENYELNFNSDNRVYTKTEILTANAKIKEVVNTIKSENLSPLESVMYVHKLLSERSYFMEQDSSKNRDVYSILNQKNIICTGFANLFCAIFNELNDPNIKVKNETLLMQNKTQFYHAINCVYINDKKYGYEGYYHLDACANCIDKNNNNGKLDAFMIPSQDVNYSYANTSTNRFLALELEQGNLENQTIPFSTNNGYYNVFNSLKNRNENYRSEALNATIQFLDTPIGNKIKNKLKNSYNYDINIFDSQERLYLDIINRVVETTKPISLDDIEKCLTVVAKKFITLKQETPEQYARRIVDQTVSDAQKFYDITMCKNSFAVEACNNSEKTL